MATLASYIQVQPCATKTFKLTKVVSQHRRSSHGPFVLAVDGEDFCRKVYDDFGIDRLCGGQWYQYLEQIRRTVDNFRSLWIHLVFFFDGWVHKDRNATDWNWKEIWKQRQAEVVQLFESLEKQNFECETNLLPPQLESCSYIALKHELGMDVYRSENDKYEEMCKFISHNNAWGVLSDNVDFYVFNCGNFILLSDFNFESLRGKLYLKEDLCRFLDIQPHHLAILATKIGNKSPNGEKNTKQKKDASLASSTMIPVLCHLIRESVDDSNFAASIVELSKTMFGTESKHQVLFILNVQRYLQNPLTEFAAKFLGPQKEVTSIFISRPADMSVLRVIPAPRIDKEVLEISRQSHRTSNTSSLIHSVLRGDILDGGLSLADGRHGDWGMVYLSVTQRLCGLLLGVQNGQPRTDCTVNPKTLGVDRLPGSTSVCGTLRLNVNAVLMYTSLGDSSTMYAVEALPPSMTETTPPLRSLWLENGPSLDTLRWRTFLSCVQCTLPLDTVRSLPAPYVLPVCVLHYLLHCRARYHQPSHGGDATQLPTQLQRHEVEALLATLVACQLGDVRSLNKQPTTCVRPSSVCVSWVYQDGVALFLTVAEACMLPLPPALCAPWRYYDGRLFHEMYMRAATGESVHRLLGNSPTLMRMYTYLVDILSPWQPKSVETPMVTASTSHTAVTKSSSQRHVQKTKQKISKSDVPEVTRKSMKPSADGDKEEDVQTTAAIQGSTKMTETQQLPTQQGSQGVKQKKKKWAKNASKSAVNLMDEKNGSEGSQPKGKGIMKGQEGTSGIIRKGQKQKKVCAEPPSDESTCYKKESSGMDFTQGFHREEVKEMTQKGCQEIPGTNIDSTRGKGSSQQEKQQTKGDMRKKGVVKNQEASKRKDCIEKQQMSERDIAIQPPNVNDNKITKNEGKQQQKRVHILSDIDSDNESSQEVEHIVELQAKTAHVNFTGSVQNETAKRRKRDSKERRQAKKLANKTESLPEKALEQTTCNMKEPSGINNFTKSEEDEAAEKLKREKKERRKSEKLAKKVLKLTEHEKSFPEVTYQNFASLQQTTKSNAEQPLEKLTCNSKESSLVDSTQEFQRTEITEMIKQKANELIPSDSSNVKNPLSSIADLERQQMKKEKKLAKKTKYLASKESTGMKNQDEKASKQRDCIEKHRTSERDIEMQSPNINENKITKKVAKQQQQRVDLHILTDIDSENESSQEAGSVQNEAAERLKRERKIRKRAKKLAKNQRVFKSQAKRNLQRLAFESDKMLQERKERKQAKKMAKRSESLPEKSLEQSTCNIVEPSCIGNFTKSVDEEAEKLKREKKERRKAKKLAKKTQSLPEKSLEQSACNMAVTSSIGDLTKSIEDEAEKLKKEKKERRKAKKLAKKALKLTKQASSFSEVIHQNDASLKQTTDTERSLGEGDEAVKLKQGAQDIKTSFRIIGKTKTCVAPEVSKKPQKAKKVKNLSQLTNANDKYEVLTPSIKLAIPSNKTQANTALGKSKVKGRNFGEEQKKVPNSVKTEKSHQKIHKQKQLADEQIGMLDVNLPLDDEEKYKTKRIQLQKQKEKAKMAAMEKRMAKQQKRIQNRNICQSNRKHEIVQQVYHEEKRSERKRTLREFLFVHNDPVHNYKVSKVFGLKNVSTSRSSRADAVKDVEKVFTQVRVNKFYVPLKPCVMSRGRFTFAKSYNINIRFWKYLNICGYKDEDKWMEWRKVTQGRLLYSRRHEQWRRRGHQKRTWDMALTFKDFVTNK